MYVIPKANWLITARISFAALLEAPEGSSYIDVHEPDTLSFTHLQKVIAEDDQEKAIAAFAELLPRVIDDHDFYEEPAGGDARKLSPAEVVELLMRRMDLMTYAVSEYTQKILFTRGKKIVGS